MDAKDELLFLLGLDLRPGDTLRRINLPEGWPQQTLIVEEVLLDRSDAPAVICRCSPPLGLARNITVFLNNIGVLYERIDAHTPAH